MIYTTKQFVNGFIAKVDITDIDRDILSDDKIHHWMLSHSKNFLIESNSVYFHRQELALLFIKELSVYQEPTKYFDSFHNIFMEISNDKLYLSEDNENKIFSYEDIQLIDLENGIPYSLTEEESLLKLKQWRIL